MLYRHIVILEQATILTFVEFSNLYTFIVVYIFAITYETILFCYRKRQTPKCNESSQVTNDSTTDDHTNDARVYYNTTAASIGKESNNDMSYNMRQEPTKPKPKQSQTDDTYANDNFHMSPQVGGDSNQADIEYEEVANSDYVEPVT